MSLGHAAQRAIDTATVGIGVSAPWWVQYTTTWFGWFAALAAAIVGAIRLAIAIRDWRQGK